MKKITSLIFVLTSFFCDAQIQGYTINATGNSNGLTISTGFSIDVVAFSVYEKSTKDSLVIEIQLVTKNNLNTLVYLNDDIKNVGYSGDVKKYILSKSTTQSIDNFMFKVQQDLESIYGGGNVIKK